jgi:hypothetical protein
VVTPQPLPIAMLAGAFAAAAVFAVALDFVKLVLLRRLQVV